MTLTKQGILSYCAAGAAFHMIASAFNFYYVKVFMNIYHIQETWFQMAQVVHMVWTAASNPLFAFLQDSTSYRFTRSRRESILYCGPLFSLSFLLPWLPWGTSPLFVGLHLIVSLFIWDTMFTFVGLALSSLFTEISDDTHDRLTLTRYAQMASILGGPSVMLLEFVSDSLHDFASFQVTTSVISVCSCVLFLYAGQNAFTKYDGSNVMKKDDCDSSSKQEYESYYNKVHQIVTDKNFMTFVIVSFLHAFHKSFLNSFIAIVCDHLIAEEAVPKAVLKTFYGSISLFSTTMIIIGTPFVSRYSYHGVIKSIFLYMLFAGFVMFHIGPNHPWILMAFLLIDNCASGATFSLFNMALADISDDNMIKYKRRYPISSTVFGSSAFLSKPALSLSPMLTVSILNSFGYNKLTGSNLEASPELKHVMFLLVCSYPFIVGFVQYIAWSFFDIKTKVQINTI